MFLVMRRRQLVSGLLAFVLIVFLFVFPWVLHGLPVSANENNPEFAVVMYHHISNKQRLLGKFVITEKQFENDLKYLKDNGYNTITVADLIDYVDKGIPLPDKPIMITFDDGFESFYVYAFPLLKKYEMKAVMSVLGSFSDLFTEKEDHQLDYSHLTWTQIKELQASGIVEIQNHSYNLHSNSGRRMGSSKFKGESAEHYKKMLTEDLGKFQKEVFDNTGWTPTAFAYPFGYISPEAREILKSMGFRAAFTCREKRVIAKQDSSEWMFSLGRFNRDHGKSSEQFFGKILS